MSDIFKSAGLCVDEVQSDLSATYATGFGFKFRALHYTEANKQKYELHIAVASNFDRWANSTDFIASLPRSAEHLKKIIAAAKNNMPKDNVFGIWHRLDVDE